MNVVTERFVFTALMVCCFGALVMGVTGCQKKSSSGAVAASATVNVDMSGSWQITVQELSENCGQGLDDDEVIRIGVTQSGNTITVVDQESGVTFTGTLNGRTLQVRVEESACGDLQIFEGSFEVAADGGSFSGQIPWTLESAGATCSGTDQWIATRVSTEVPPPLATLPDITGTWLLTETVVSSDCAGPVPGDVVCASVIIEQVGSAVAVLDPTTGDTVATGCLRYRVLELEGVDFEARVLVDENGRGLVGTFFGFETTPACEYERSIVGLKTQDSTELFPSCVAKEILVGTTTGSTVGETDDFFPDCTSGDGGFGSDASFLFVAPESGHYTFDTVGTQFWSIVSLLDGDCDTVLGCADPDSKTFGCEEPGSAEVTRFLTAGQRVVVVVDGFCETSEGDYTLNITLDIEQVTLGTNTGSTVGHGDDFFPTCTFSDGGYGPDVAVVFVAPFDGFYSFDTTGSEFYTVVTVLAQDCVTELECGASLSGSCGDPVGASASLLLAADEVVVVVVDGFCPGDEGNYVLEIVAALP